MSDKPQVTAVITTCARPHYVYEALDSVCAEMHENIECLVVDDGGTFELRDVDSRVDIRVVRGEKLGVGHARNVGLAAARGEFVIFLDDDDVALPHRIATLLDAATRVHADLCFGMTRRVVTDSGMVLPDVPTRLMSSGPVGFLDLLACAPHINSVLVRTAVLRSVGGFDIGAEHFDDWSAWLRIADQNATMWCVGEVVAEWRIHSDGLTGDVSRKRAMKHRLLTLFDRLHSELSQEHAPAIDAARSMVAASELVTYDQYAAAMASSASH
ncbi:MAG TPA: glycosyltransferase family 2 protein [Thermoanaerobaculia bacterium]|nr:glycosyltransferase family 2 protein [Thermoanaerobaculia bacterium]